MGYARELRGWLCRYPPSRGSFFEKLSCAWNLHRLDCSFFSAAKGDLLPENRNPPRPDKERTLPIRSCDPQRQIEEIGIGTIETGKCVDLVVLDANPLMDIGNTRRMRRYRYPFYLLSSDIAVRLPIPEPLFLPFDWSGSDRRQSNRVGRPGILSYHHSN